MTRVVTGQQIGILGGETFILYKIIGAIKEAEAKKITACFWMETNDADFEEINKINYVNSNGEINSISWQKNTDGFSCGKIVVDENLIEKINFFFQDVKQTEHTESLKKICLDCYRKGDLLENCYQKLIKILFKNYPLEVFNPSDEQFLKSSQEILEEELEQTPLDSKANVFIRIDNKRIAIFKNKQGEFVNRRQEKIDLSKGILLPSVFNRSIIQDSKLNTDSYICGENEEKYLIELQEKYQKYNFQFPILKKRMSAYIQSDITKSDANFSMALFEKIKSDNNIELTKENFLKSVGFDKKIILQKAEKIKQEFIDKLKSLNLATKEIEKSLYKELKKTLKTNQKKIKKKYQKELQEIENIYLTYHPKGKTQEKFYHLFYYLNLYGLELIDKVYQQYDFKKNVFLKNL